MCVNVGAAGGIRGALQVNLGGDAGKAGRGAWASVGALTALGEAGSGETR